MSDRGGKAYEQMSGVNGFVSPVTVREPMPVSSATVEMHRALWEEARADVRRLSAENLELRVRVGVLEEKLRARGKGKRARE